VLLDQGSRNACAHTAGSAGYNNSFAV